MMILPLCGHGLYAWTLKGLVRIPGADLPSVSAAKVEPASDRCLFEMIDDLSICDDPEVRAFIHVYLTRGRPYVIKSFQRSRIYFDEVDRIVRATPGMPVDMALLPLLESGYSPVAVSRSRAVGLWQFLGGTAKILGLRDDVWVDDRRDIEKSTLAAMRHLGSLHSVFGSWDLALAAYNGGAGHLRRAMIKTGRTSLRDLKKAGALRRETSEYVARYAALMVIYKNRDLFGIEDEMDTHDPREIGTIELEFPVHLARLARAACITTEEIRKLNPQLKSALTPIYARGYRLRLPKEAVQLLEDGDDSSYAIRFTEIKKHVVRRGDSLNKIARRYNSDPKSIMLINDIRDPRRLRPGRAIYIPI